MIKQTFFLGFSVLLFLQFQSYCMDQNHNALTAAMPAIAIDNTIRLHLLQAAVNAPAAVSYVLLEDCLGLLADTIQEPDSILHSQAASLALTALGRNYNETQGMMPAPFFIYCYQLKQLVSACPIQTANINKLESYAINKNNPGHNVVARKLFN